MNNKKNNALKEKRDYDILNMLNSISNFEIFTPFEITSSMIELLPEDVFKHPEYKFLDPCVKSGIFLREIVYKLDKHLPRIKYTDPESHLEYDLSNKKERTTHILRNMIYGIAISELTAYVTRRTLYGVMEANADKIDEYLESKITVIEFEKKTKKKDKKQKAEDRKIEDLDFNEYYNHDIFNTEDRTGFESEGNIFYPIDETTIETEDTHYPFINKTKHNLINNIKEEKMKFDVIIGNPPYQKNDGGGNGSSAVPIYQYFIEEAKKLQPKYISIIIPARWYSGGRGLDSFREDMLNDKCISKLVDFPDSKKCFPNVDIEGGICYFLWDKNHKKNNIEYYSNSEKEIRQLNQYDIFIRQNKALSIVNNVLKKSKNGNISDIVSPQKPFGIRGAFSDFSTNENESYNIYTKKGVFLIDKLNKDIKKPESFKKYKVIVGKANGGAMKNGKIMSTPFIIKPEEICTESFIVLGHFEDSITAENYLNYTKTKFFRFLMMLRKPSLIMSRNNMLFIPMLDFTKKWNDKELYSHFNLNEEEIKYIEDTISFME